MKIFIITIIYLFLSLWLERVLNGIFRSKVSKRGWETRKNSNPYNNKGSVKRLIPVKQDSIIIDYIQL